MPEKVEPDVLVGLMDARMPFSPTRASGSTFADERASARYADNAAVQRRIVVLNRR